MSKSKVSCYHCREKLSTAKRKDQKHNKEDLKRHKLKALIYTGSSVEKFESESKREGEKKDCKCGHDGEWEGIMHIPQKWSRLMFIGKNAQENMVRIWQYKSRTSSLSMLGAKGFKREWTGSKLKE